jgi:REP element-mobilizing transposase RayT
MARQVRVQYPGAVYHVMSRGDHQKAIYRDDADREQFLRCLEEACEKTGWLIDGCVLMGNHYQLLVETPQANLVAGMKWLQGTYTDRVRDEA